MIEDELVSFLEWTAGTEIGGAIEIEMARTVAGTIGRLLTKVSQIVASLKTLVSAKVIAAAEKVAPGLLKNKLLDELAAQGIKHEPGQQWIHRGSEPSWQLTTDRHSGSRVSTSATHSGSPSVAVGRTTFGPRTSTFRRIS